MRPLLLIGIVFALWGCSKSDDLDIRLIFITVDKEIALEGGDTIRISAEVKDQDLNLIPGLELEFFANDVPLPDSNFITDKRGEFVLQAQYRGVESNRVTVRVVNLAADLEGLTLLYDGYQQLTTNDWSVSGNFSYEATIDRKSFPIDPTEVELLLDGTPTEQMGQFHFPEGGVRAFQARAGEVISNVIELEVRPEETFEEIVLPVIFHAYGIESPRASELRRFIDTLNNSFNRESFDLRDVLAGNVNPNAVNCHLRFELARNPPSGKRLAEPGLNLVINEDGQYPPLTAEVFAELEKQHVWDPEIFINVWLAENYEFEYEPINRNEVAGSGGGRGLVHSPYLIDVQLPGLPTFGANPRDPDPNTLSQSILLRTISVLTEHPDFIVNRMGYFLGLFDTMTFGCLSDGDYCPDTVIPDFSRSERIGNAWKACGSENFYTLNNHMSIGRNYTNFTYDQRLACDSSWSTECSGPEDSEHALVKPVGEQLALLAVNDLSTILTMYFQSEIDFGMMVLIWIVQLIIYPGFLHYRVAALRKWHSSYTRLITWIVLPLMLGQVVVHGLGLWYDAHAVRWFQLIFIVMSWALTFFRAVPLHNKIQEGVGLPANIELLIRWNWPRTILWTAIFLLDIVHMFYLRVV